MRSIFAGAVGLLGLAYVRRRSSGLPFFGERESLASGMVIAFGIVIPVCHRSSWYSYTLPGSKSSGRLIERRNRARTLPSTSGKILPFSSFAPRKSETMMRWPVEETGRNSVSPSTIPRITESASGASSIGMRSYCFA